MTEQEQREFEDGAHEHGLRCAVLDNIERFGKDRVTRILATELAIFGIIVVVDNARD